MLRPHEYRECTWGPQSQLCTLDDHVSNTGDWGRGNLPPLSHQDPLGKPSCHRQEASSIQQAPEAGTRPRVSVKGPLSTYPLYFMGPGTQTCHAPHMTPPLMNSMPQAVLLQLPKAAGSQYILHSHRHSHIRGAQGEGALLPCFHLPLLSDSHRGSRPWHPAGQHINFHQMLEIPIHHCQETPLGSQGTWGHC